MKLLEHRCFMCERAQVKPWSFESFQQLKDHMRREHELFYCDLCCEHLKIFSFERQCYTRQELAYHRRKGDKKNTSHRGHPLCEFCDTRFMDNDELFRHMRRTHLFCHFCDADGKHQYYHAMEDLKRHFREEHFLCEEGECKGMPLTAVFRTEIDLKAHIATDHSRYMSKSATRQARTLDIGFTMAPRPRTDNNRNRRPPDQRFTEDTFYNVEPGGPGGSYDNRQMFVNPLTSDQFPALGGNASNANNITLVSKNYTKFSSAAFNSNDFPSLGGPTSGRTPAVTIRTNSAGASAPEVTITRTVRNQPVAQKSKENFPALGGGGGGKPPGSTTVRLSVNSNNQQQTPKVSIQVNQNSNGGITTHITTSAPSSSQRTEVFPALSKAGQPSAQTQPQWVQQKPKKPTEAKTAKVAPCPTLETGNLDLFPSLSKGKGEKPKKTSSVTVPVDSWVNLNSIKNSKQNKKPEQGTSKTDNEGESSAKGAGDTKKSEPNKKAGPKPTSNSTSEATALLRVKLDNLKLVEVKKPQTDESKKTKKKKAKNTTDANDNTAQPDNNKGETTKNQENKTDTINDSRDVNHNEEEHSSKNGLSKKRTELKIGALGGNSLRNCESFPSLGGAKPPPGFTDRPQTSFVPPPPPPGFNSNDFPTLGMENNLTFTTSSGQSYAIIPTNDQSAFKQPVNFQNRNQQLIKRIMEVLNDNEAIRDFKKLSDNFRNNEVNAKKYTEQCVKVLGGKFDDIFPELLVLLPDIQKQQELYREIRGRAKENLLVCEKCKQVIFKKELREHYNYHQLESHFPSLGAAQHVQSAWKK